jgi:hypothetical protein
MATAHDKYEEFRLIAGVSDLQAMAMSIAHAQMVPGGPAVAAPTPPTPRAKTANVSFTHPSFKWDAKNMWDEWETFEISVTKAWKMPGYSAFTDAEKISCVETWMGVRVDEIVDAWSDEDAAKHRATYELFMLEISTRWKPLHNKIHNELKFAECIRDKSQTIQAYLDQLNRLAKKCTFDTERVRTKFIENLNDAEMRRRILEEQGTIDNLKDVVSLCLRIEAGRETDSRLHKQFDAVSSKPNRGGGGRGGRGGRGNARGNARGGHAQESSGPRCSRCNRQHQQGKEFCRAIGNTCYKCQGKDHYSVVCRSSADGKKSDAAPHVQRGGRGGRSRGGNRGRGGSGRGRGSTHRAHEATTEEYENEQWNADTQVAEHAEDAVTAHYYNPQTFFRNAKPL